MQDFERFSRRLFLAGGVSTVLTNSHTSSAADSAEDNQRVNANNPEVTPSLDFGFIKNPPGQLYSIGGQRLHARLFGKGNAKTTVLFEPGLGGSSLEWLPLSEQLSEHAQVVLYDRGGYAWSDPGTNPRHVSRLAAEAYLLLREMNIEGPLILVGHSFGGLIMRQLAAITQQEIRGLVLVDASHEKQFERMSDTSQVAMLPSSKHFVLAAPELPNGLRPDLKHKIQAFARMRKTYTILHAEISSFAASCQHILNTRKTFSFPVTVISRGKNPHRKNTANDNDNKQGRDDRNKIWHELQADLLNLSPSSKQVIAKESGHHIHIDEPDYVKQAVMELL